MWRWLWIAWIVAVLVTFFIIEIAGYSQHGTLSEQIWRWLGIGREITWSFAVRRAILAFFLIWAFLHFLFQVE